MALDASRADVARGDGLSVGSRVALGASAGTVACLLTARFGVAASGAGLGVALGAGLGVALGTLGAPLERWVSDHVRAPAARVAVPTTRALVGLVAGGAIGVVLAARSVRIGDRGVDALVPSVAVWSVVGCVLCLLLAALRARRFDSAR